MLSPPHLPLQAVSGGKPNPNTHDRVVVGGQSDQLGVVDRQPADEVLDEGLGGGAPPGFTHRCNLESGDYRQRPFSSAVVSAPRQALKDVAMGL